MTDILPPAGWPNVRQLETKEFATGGANGNMNEQAKSLAARSELLKKYAALPYESKTGGYALNERVQLATGDIVRSTIASNVNNPNENMTGWVKTNDASQIFDLIGESQQQVNDKISNKTYFIITPEMFGAKGFPHDDTASLQEALDFISPTQWDTSVAVMNQKGGGGRLVLPRRYRTTDTLWVGAYTTIEGMGVLGFNSSLLENVSAIVTDFTDPLKPAMSSSNWKTGGVRVAYDEQTAGAMYDNGLVSATHGIKASGFSLLTKSGTRCYMGFRLQNSPQSDINIYANGFDYGIMSNASWESKIDCRSLSYKCGLLLNNDNNNTAYNGYYNSLVGTPISTGTNLIDYFTSDTDTDTSLNDANTQFGVINRYSYGSSATSIIAESNGVGLATWSCDTNIQSLYTEKNTIAGYVGVSNPSSVTIGGFTGSGDAYACILGANSKTTILASNKNGITQGRYFKKLSRWNSELVAPLYLNEYIAGIKYSNSEPVFYVSSSGNDLNNGKVDAYPLATLDEAFKRATIGYLSSDKTLTSPNIKSVNIVLLTADTYNFTGSYNVYSDIYVTSKSSSIVPTIQCSGSGHLRLNNSRVFINGCNVTKANVSGATDNAIVWSFNGVNSLSISGGTTNILNGGLLYCDYNGSSEATLSLNGVTVTGNANSQLVQGNYLNTSPHIVNVVVSRGAIDLAITSRSDKGISVPATWQAKILGI